MSKSKAAGKRRARLSIEPLEPRRLLDVSGVWQELGFRAASGGGLTYTGLDVNAADPAVALTTDGQPVVAYEQSGAIYAKLFDGQAWLSLSSSGSAIPNSGGGRDPDIAVDDFGNVFVSWIEGSGSGADVYMAKGSWNQTSGAWQWYGLGGSNVGDGVSDDGVVNGTPAIAVGLDGIPVMAYSALDAIPGDMDVVAKKFVPDPDGGLGDGEWVELTGGAAFDEGGGGVSNDAMASGGTLADPQAVDIAIGGDNAPIVVWSTEAGSLAHAQIYARRWDAATWTWAKIGGESATDAGDTPVGGVSDTTTESYDPLIAIRQDPDNPNQDIVVVAWRERSVGDDDDYTAIYLKQLDDPTPETGSWTTVGDDSASGDGVIGRGYQRDLSLTIGADGLPLLGATRYQAAWEELAIDTTPPWSRSNVLSDGSSEACNWYAWSLEAYRDGSDVEWAWTGGGSDGESANYGVNQARYTTIAELDDGSPLLLFGENVYAITGPANANGGPWDPGYYPTGVTDQEIYALRWDESSSSWVSHGDGAGEFGGIDNDLRWNSDPVLATMEDGTVLAAYTEREGSELFIRVDYYDNDTNEWLALGTGLETGIDLDANEIENHTYRYDELAIGSDPYVSVGETGSVVIAYLDMINTTGGGASIDQHSTITAWQYDELSGEWDRLMPSGATGVDQYVYVSEGEVWDGYLSDQIEIVAGPGNGAYIAWRNVDPEAERDPTGDLVHLESLVDGGREPYDEIHGRSDIYLQQWVPDGITFGSWENVGQQTSPFSATPGLHGLDFDPSLLLGTGGHVWLAFTAGDLGDDGILVSDIAVFDFDPGTNAWANRTTGALRAPDDSTHAYAHPQLALGTGAGQQPMVVFEDQTWELHTVMDLGLLGTSAATSLDPNSRPFWDDDDEAYQWRFVPPEVEDMGTAIESLYEDRPSFQGELSLSTTSVDYTVRLPGFNDSFYSTAGGGWLEIVLTSVGGDLEPVITVTQAGGDLEVEGTYVEAWGEFDSNGLNVEFEISSDNTLTVDMTDTGYTVEVRWSITTVVAEDRFQELTSSAIRTAQYNGSSWSETGYIEPDAGRAYVLPEVVGGGGLTPTLTYTSIELDNAGFTNSAVTLWKGDMDGGSWSQAARYYTIDLGLRTYMNGEYGQQGYGFTSQRWYSDPIASYFNPQIMYGARHMDFEFAWWRNLCGSGTPTKWWTIIDSAGGKVESPGPAGWGATRHWNDYRTPLPGDSETSGSKLGWRADGHVAVLSCIHALRYNGSTWEAVNSQTESGTVLPSDEDPGLSARTSSSVWMPGFGSSIAIHGPNDSLAEAVPVVAWNQAERNLIHVRQWMPEQMLPKLEVTETSGETNDDRLAFGTLEVGQSGDEYLVLKNTGDEVLTIQGLEIAGSDAFEVTNFDGTSITYPITIGIGGSKILRVHAEPTEPGAMYATLYIFSNDPLADPLFSNWYPVALVGTAYSGGDIDVTEDVGIPNDLVVPFDLVTIGNTSNRTVTIENDGSGVLNVDLYLYGVGQGFSLAGGSSLAIDPGTSQEVEIVFEGVAGNQNGAIGYLVIHHDDYGGYGEYQNADPQIVTLVGNLPSLMTPTTVGAGTLPTVSLNTVAFINELSGLGLYDIDLGGLISDLGIDGIGRPRSDGDFTVFAMNGDIWAYDYTTGGTINLTEGLGVSEAQNPNIAGTRVVFAAAADGGHDIHVIDLKLSGNSINVGDPVDTHQIIDDPNPSTHDHDDYPDVSGDWVVWRRGTADGSYTVYAQDLNIGVSIEISAGALSGARIPRVSGDHAVWVEYNGGNRVYLYKKNEGGGELFLQQAEVSQEVAIHGDLLVWAEKRSGNFDLFGYFLDDPEDTGGGVDVRERQFQLTFSPDVDEVAPDAWGSWVAWQEEGDSTSTIKYAALSAVADVQLVHDGTVLEDGDTIDFQNLVVDIDGRYWQSTILEVSNIGTGMLSILDVIGTITTGSAEIQVILPDKLTVQQGSEPAQIEIRMRATDDGVLSGSLEVQTNDPLDNLITLNLAAMADEPTIAVRDAGDLVITTIDLGTFEAGVGTGTGTFYVWNETPVGDTPLVYGLPVVSDPALTVTLVGYTGMYESYSGTMILDPGEYAQYEVTWSPATPATMAATITISSNDVEPTPVVLDVIGEAEGYPYLRVLNGAVELPTGGTLDFGAVLKSDDVDRVVTLLNYGMDVLTFSPDPSVSGSPAFELILPPGWTGELGPGESVDITIRFTPDAAGGFAGALSIDSDSQTDPDYDLNLVGTGYVVPEITVLQGLVDVPSDSTIYAATTEVGQVDTIHLTIRNDGESDLEIEGWTLVPIGATPAGVFEVDFGGHVTAFSLAPTEWVDVTVTFTPPAIGSYSGLLAISNNDGNEGDYFITFSGEGIAPVIDVPVTIHDFGNVVVGDMASLTFSITNDGQADLALDQWVSSNPDIFEIVPANPAGAAGDVVLGPGESTPIQVVFSPDAGGNHVAMLTFYSNDPASPTTLVSLSGWGGTGEIAVWETSGQQNDNQLVFGNVEVNTTMTVDVTIANTGDGVLHVTSWSSDNPAFALLPTFGDVYLLPADFTTLQVAFTPTNTGVFSGEITITSDDDAQPTWTLTATGSGIASAIVVTEQSGQVGDDRLEFGDVLLGQQTTQSFVMRNEGGANLVITGWEIDYVGASQDLGLYTLDLELVGGQYVVPTSAEDQVIVTYAPTDAGTHDATLRLFTNDPDDAVYEIELTGRGVEPDIAVLEDSGQQSNDDRLVFGAVKVGTSEDIVVTIRNDGEVPLDLTSWTSTDAAFSLDPVSPQGGLLGPGETTQVTVRYTPDEEGPHTGQIEIASNDLDQPTYTLDVVGTGIAPSIRVTETVGTTDDDRISFGDVIVGETGYASFTVHNDGQAPLVVSVHDTTNVMFSIVPANGVGSGDDLTIQPGDSLTLNVQFSPIWTLTETGTVTLVSDAANTPRYVITVDGTGVPEPVAGDFNQSGQTDMADFELFEAAFGSKVGDSNYDPKYDLAGPDGVIDFADLAVFADAYGQSSGKSAPKTIQNEPVIVTSPDALMADDGQTVVAFETSGQAVEQSDVDATAGDGVVLMENLAAAFDSGALPDGSYAAADLLAARALAPVSVEAAEDTASLAVSPASAGLPAAAVEPPTTRSFVMASAAETSTSDTPGADELGQLDAAIAPYAAALLPG